MPSAPARVLATALVLAALLAAPLGAAASVGPVPPAVRAYVTGGGLAEDLAGQGIGGEVEPGPASRVFRWTEERLAGDIEGKPVWMVNEWAVPVTSGGAPVGVAIVALDLDTAQPGLVELLPDTRAAVALAGVPDDAELVRDAGSGAWFALVGDTATPLAPGTSGVTGPTPVDALELAPPEGTVADAEPETRAADAAPGLGGILAAASVLAALLATLLVIARAERVIR